MTLFAFVTLYLLGCFCMVVGATTRDRVCVMMGLFVIVGTLALDYVIRVPLAELARRSVTTENSKQNR
jgi:hypothetical protein